MNLREETSGKKITIIFKVQQQIKNKKDFKIIKGSNSGYKAKLIIYKKRFKK